MKAIKEKNPCLIYNNEKGINALKSIIHTNEVYRPVLKSLKVSRPQYEVLMNLGPRENSWDERLEILAKEGIITAQYQLMLTYSGLLSGLNGHERYRKALDYNSNLLNSYPDNFFLLFLRSLIKDKLGYSEEEVLDDFVVALSAKSFKSVIAEDVRTFFKFTNGDATKMILSYTILGVSGDIDGRVLFAHLIKFSNKIKTELMKEIFPKISVVVQSVFDEISKRGIELIHWDPSSYLIYNEVCTIMANIISRNSGTRLCLTRKDIIQRIGINSHKLFNTIPLSNNSTDECPLEEFNSISKKILNLSKERF